MINGTEDNGTEDVPAAITDTIPVFADNVKDTIVKDDYWSVEEICTQAVRAGLQGRGHPVATTRYPEARGEGAMNQSQSTAEPLGPIRRRNLSSR